MLLHAAPSLILNCVKVRTDWQNQELVIGEMKSGVSTGKSPSNWPAGNLLKHNLRETLSIKTVHDMTLEHFGGVR